MSLPMFCQPDSVLSAVPSRLSEPLQTPTIPSTAMSPLIVVPETFSLSVTAMSLDCDPWLSHRYVTA